jgi:hypothetical protein
MTTAIEALMIMQDREQKLHNNYRKGIQKLTDKQLKIQWKKNKDYVDYLNDKYNSIAERVNPFTHTASFQTVQSTLKHFSYCNSIHLKEFNVFNDEMKKRKLIIN